MSYLKKMAFFLIFILMAGVLHGCQPDAPSISQEQAWEIVKKEVLKEKLDNKIISQYTSLLNAGQEIKSWGQIQKVPATYPHAWFFFVDEQPGANWGHDCLYVFVDVATGQFTIIKSSSPPDTMEGMIQRFPLTDTQH